jgi:hypothetical protein
MNLRKLLHSLLILTSLFAFRSYGQATTSGAANTTPKSASTTFSKWGWGIQNGLSLNSFNYELPHTGINVGYTGGFFIERNLGKNFYTRVTVGYTGAGGELVTFKDDTRYGMDPMFSFKNVKQSSYLLQSVDTYIDFIYKRKTASNWSYYLGVGGGMANKFGEFEQYDKTGEFIPGIYGTVHNKQFTNRFENYWFNGNGLIGISVPTKSFDLFVEAKLIMGVTDVRPNYSYIEYEGVTSALKTNALQFTVGISNLFKKSK